MLTQETTANPTQIELVSEPGLEAFVQEQNAAARAWIERTQFKAAANQHAWLPDVDGNPTRLVAGIGDQPSLTSLGSIAAALPAGSYTLDTSQFSAAQRYVLLLGWGLGSYRYTRYSSKPEAVEARLEIAVEDNAVLDEVAAVALTRDLINTPANDMMPADLETAARKLVGDHDARLQVTNGDDLLSAGYNTIHAVGRASVASPRLIDLRWGEASAPRVTLVGKGVCFDSGGLNIKPAGGMRSMKKDMGGAAHVLGLASLIMRRKLPVQLRVLVPAVENAISANAYRPGDVIRSYGGITIEIDNTDAEGRLVLCDALALATEESPEIIIDYATLTGAARVAVGTEIAAMFCNNDEAAEAILASGDATEDPVWRLPLHAGYEHMLASKVADTVNSSTGGFAGATTAALFLQKFVGDTPWVHFDVMAWNLRNRPAHPEGGEAMAVRSVFSYLEKRYGS